MEIFLNTESLVIKARSQADWISNYLCTVCETICCIVVEPSYLLYIMNMNHGFSYLNSCSCASVIS